MAKKYVWLIITLIPFILFTGCWSRKEVEDLAIVTAMGFDKGEDGKIHLTVQIIKPGLLAKGGGPGGGGGGGGTERPYWNVEGSGQTIIETVRDLNMKSPRRLFFAHNQFFVFGSELAREGLAPYLDRIARSPEIRRTENVLVTEGKASDIIKTKLTLERVPALGIAGLIRREFIISRSFAPTIREFFILLSSKGIDPVAGKIEITREKKTGDQISENNATHTTKSLLLGGLAVFRKDKLVGFLNPKETRGYLWTQGNVPRGIITISQEEQVAFEVLRSSGDIKVKKEGNRLMATVKINEEDDLVEHVGFEKFVPGEFELYNRRKTAVIRNEIVLAIERAKEMKADIFGFGDTLRRSQPKEWKSVEKNWDNDFFPELVVNIDIKSKTRRRGMINVPPPFVE